MDPNESRIHDWGQNLLKINEDRIRAEMVEVGRRLHEYGMIAGYDGNIAARVAQNSFLITKAFSSLGYLTEHDIVKIDREGNVLEGDCRPTGEFRLHMVAYRERADIVCTVHAHPMAVTAFATVNEPIPGYVFPEVGIIFGGDIPVAPFGAPFTPEIAESIAELIRDHDALMMARHGAIVVSRSGLFDAYNKLEKMELVANTYLLAKQLGRVESIPADQIEILKALRTQRGLDHKPARE